MFVATGCDILDGTANCNPENIPEPPASADFLHLEPGMAIAYGRLQERDNPDGRLDLSA